MQGLAAFKQKDHTWRMLQVVILAIGSPKHPVARRASRLRGTRFGSDEGAGRRRRPVWRLGPTRRCNKRERHDKQSRLQASRDPNAHLLVSFGHSGSGPVTQTCQPAETPPARAVTGSRALVRKADKRDGAGPRQEGATWRESGRRGDGQGAESAPSALLAGFDRRPRPTRRHRLCDGRWRRSLLEPRPFPARPPRPAVAAARVGLPSFMQTAGRVAISP